jgi:hypothetical protein
LVPLDPPETSPSVSSRQPIPSSISSLIGVWVPPVSGSLGFLEWTQIPNSVLNFEIPYLEF